jgi:hypothetical protein
MSSDWSVPCATFQRAPTDVPYPDYCHRCHFHRVAHDRWDLWDSNTQAARASESRAAEAGRARAVQP